MYKLYCCGSRGSRPVEGRRFNEFGGFTTCYILKTYNYALIIDAGTGFYEANAIVSDCSTIDVVFTHVHYDHILGMRDWTAIPKTSKVTFYGNFDGWFGDKTMYEFFRAPFWPVQPNFNINQCPKDGEPLKLRKDLQVKFYNSPHPNATKLMMIETNCSPDENPIDLAETDPKDIHKLAVMFDCEKSDGLDASMITNIDMVVYDGMYTDDEYPTKVGFGHSTWQEGCRLAAKVKPEKLIITHHSPNRVDSDLRKYEEEARKMFPNTDFARSGQIWDFPLYPNGKEKKARVAKPTLEQMLSDENELQTYSNTDNLNLIQRGWKYITSILLDPEKSEVYLSTLVYLAIGITSLFMTILNVMSRSYYLALATGSFGIASILNYVIVKKINSANKVISAFAQVEIMSLFVLFLIIGDPGGFSIIWSLLLPTAGMLVFGRRKTIILCAVYFVILVCMFWTPLGEIFLMRDAAGEFKYSHEIMVRFPIAFLAFAFIGLIIEIVMSFGYKKLNTLKNNLANVLADQTSELRDQNFELIRVNSQLNLRNRLLNKTYGKFMTDQVVEEVLENANTTEVTGKKSVVTLLQADIRGFASKTKDMDPSDIFEMLNNYFGEMTEIIQKHHGVILDYVGDAILVVFGAPLSSETHADDAIETAIEMQKVMRKVNSWNRVYGYNEIEIGIGIHTGEAILGIVGSKNHMKFDVVGKAVSLTSRIEHVCKGKSILVTDEVLKSVSKAVKIAGVTTHTLKGFEDPISLFEITE